MRRKVVSGHLKTLFSWMLQWSQELSLFPDRPGEEKHKSLSDGFILIPERNSGFFLQSSLSLTGEEPRDKFYS